MKLTSKLLLIGALTTGISVAGIVGAEASSVLGDTAAFTQLEGAIEELQTKRANLDRSQFDPDELLESLDFDGERIIAFVTEEIAFQDYPGLLRGIEGTLRSRSGNSLDQSTLLASLLRSAGFDARIASGSLDATSYRAALLDEPLPARSPATIFTQNTGAGGARQATGSANREFASGEAASRMKAHIEALARGLSSRVGTYSRDRSSGVSEGQFSPVYWVEWRSGPSSPWRRAFPALADALRSIEGNGYINEEIPQELQQTVSIQAFIERRWGGKRETRPLTSIYRRPAALLIGEAASMTFALVPDTFLTEPSGETLSERVSSASMFLPVIDGQPAPGALAVTSAGDLVPAAEAFSSMSGVFRTVTNKLDLAASAIASDGEDSADPIRQLERVWLQIETSTPQRPPRAFVRELAIWNGDKRSFNAQLTREVTLTVQTGRTSPAYFVDSTVAAVDGVYRTLVASQSGDSADAETDTAVQRRLKQYEAERYFAQSDMLSAAFGWGEAYRHEPTVVAQYRALAYDGLAETGFDVITSPIRFPSLRTTESNSYVSAGLLNALIEHAYFGGRGLGSASAPQQLLIGAGQSGWKRVTDPADRLLAQLPDRASEIARRELANGYVLLFPTESNGDAPSAWWKAHPETGEFIATLDNGWGGVETTSDVNLRTWLIKLAGTHGPVKVFAAASGCSMLYASARVSQALSLSEAAGPIADFFEISFNPCDLIVDPFWQAACVVGVAAIAVLTQAADIVTEEAAYGAFMKACVSFVVFA